MRHVIRFGFQKFGSGLEGYAAVSKMLLKEEEEEEEEEEEGYS